MSDILISGTNNVFESLEKPGYSINFNTIFDDKTQEAKYKIIYKNIKSPDDTTIISNSVIFNTIYSHEINENDIPLVEYYNLLIENKNNPANIQQGPSAVAPYQPDKPQAEQPLQTRSNSPPNSIKIEPYNPMTLNFQSTLITPPSPSSSPPPSPSSSPPSYPPPPSPFPPPPPPPLPPPLKTTYYLSSLSNTIRKFFTSIIIQLLRTNLKSADIILGTAEKTGNENNSSIKPEYWNRYPPGYTGEISKIHMANNKEDTLDFNYEHGVIRQRAEAWDEYIKKNIPNLDKDNKLQKEREYHNHLRDYFNDVTGVNITLYNNYFNAQIWMRDNAKNNEKYYQYDLVVYRDKLLTDLFMNKLYSTNPPVVIPQNLPEDRLDFFDADQEKYYFNSVNQYGYPILRAYYLNNQLYQYFIEKFRNPSPLQRTRSTGGMLFERNLTLEGIPLNNEESWIKYATDIKNGSTNFQPSSFQGALYGNFTPPAISSVPQSPITNKYAWDCKDGQITRFNGYYDMNYDRIKKDIFEYNENKNMNIKFFIFSKEDIQTQAINRPTTIIILKTSENTIDPIIVTSSEAFLQDNKEKLENKIIAKISTTADVGDTYILFNVDIIGNIKDAKIYKEEDKYKYDFVNLNNDLKKIIEYYNTISNLPYFRTYNEIKKQLTLFKETYRQNPNEENLLISIYKEELKLRISICDNIIVSSGIDNSIEKNIKKYKDLLDYTYKNIDNYPDKKDYFERINKCVLLLIDRVRYYGENFIY